MNKEATSNCPYLFFFFRVTPVCALMVCFVLFCLFLLGKPAQREGARTGLRSYARCSTLHYPERPER